MNDSVLAEARILVVDDSLAIRTLLATILEEEGAAVSQAESGEEVLSRLGVEKFDLILLDLSLPGMNGFAVCERLRAQPHTARLPIIVVTGQSDIRHHADALEHGADDFLAKPLMQRIILARVANLLRTHKAERENRRLLRELERYMPTPAVAQAYRRNPAESIEASILFSDMRDFTSAAAREATERVFEGVNIVMGHQAEIIEASGGYVDKFAGDGMLAVFTDLGGAHTEKAVEAGMRIVEWAYRFTGVSIWNPLPIGVGIATGDVVRGSLGSQERQEFTVIGSTVNLACRLCGLAERHEVVLCNDTYASVSVTAVRKQVRLKGLTEPQSVWVRAA